MRVRFRIGDIIVISAVLLVAAALFLAPFFARQSEAMSLLVRYNGEEKAYSLSENKSFEITNRGYTLEVLIEGRSVRVASCNCPDKTCLHTGAITQSGEMIACVPAGVTLTLTGEEAGYDFIAG